jgi:hypothetical protein
MKNPQSRPTDVWAAENNCVVAVYATNPAVTRQEPEELKAVPCLFYVGTTRSHIIAQMKADGIHFGTGAELQALRKVAQIGGDVDNEPVTSKIPRSCMGTCLVPYSFGVHHEDDLKQNRRVRSHMEYLQLMAALTTEHNHRSEQMPMARPRSIWEHLLSRAG